MYYYIQETWERGRVELPENLYSSTLFLSLSHSLTSYWFARIEVANQQIEIYTRYTYCIKIINVILYKNMLNWLFFYFLAFSHIIFPFHLSINKEENGQNIKHDNTMWIPRLTNLLYWVSQAVHWFGGRAPWRLFFQTSKNSNFEFFF
jgi:hypothetical protein